MLLVIAKRLRTLSFINIAISPMSNLRLTGLVVLHDLMRNPFSSHHVAPTRISDCQHVFYCYLGYP